MRTQTCVYVRAGMQKVQLTLTPSAAAQTASRKRKRHRCTLTSGEPGAQCDTSRLSITQTLNWASEINRPGGTFQNVRFH